MKQLFAAALLALAALFDPRAALAEAPPQGSFLLGTYVWPEHILPRYAMLTFEGGQMELRFLSPLPLDFDRCDKEGVCENTVLAATSAASVEDGVLTLQDFEIDEDAVIESGVRRHLGIPSFMAYTNYFISFLQMARLEVTETGFHLDSAGSALEFFQVAPEDALAIIAVPVMFEESIMRMAACEVRALAPLLAKPDPTEKEARFRRVLGGFRTSLEYDFKARRAAPFMGEPSEEARLEASKLNAASRMPGMIAGIFRTPEEGGLEVFRAEIGLKMFRDDAEALDAAIDAYGTALPDMIAFFRHVPTVAERRTVEGICEDPSLGFMD